MGNVACVEWLAQYVEEGPGFDLHVLKRKKEREMICPNYALIFK